MTGNDIIAVHIPNEIVGCGSLRDRIWIGQMVVQPNLIILKADRCGSFGRRGLLRIVSALGSVFLASGKAAAKYGKTQEKTNKLFHVVTPFA